MRFPMSIRNEIDVVFDSVLAGGPTVHCQGAGIPRPVGLAELHPVPRYLRAARHRGETDTTHRGMGPPERDQQPKEPAEVRVLFFQIPINPANGVILAIRVVVGLLGAAELITSGRAPRK